VVICTQTTISQIKPETIKAQPKTVMTVIYNELSDKDKSKEPIYTVVELTAQFPGGEQKLQEYISQNLHYPTSAKDKSIHGKVVVRFVIFETGKVGKCEIVRSLDPECDKEALRLVQSMPNWIPEKQGEKNIAVYYTLPISFELQKSIRTEIKPVDRK